MSEISYENKYKSIKAIQFILQIKALNFNFILTNLEQ